MDINNAWRDHQRSYVHDLTTKVIDGTGCFRKFFVTVDRAFIDLVYSTALHVQCTRPNPIRENDVVRDKKHIAIVVVAAWNGEDWISRYILVKLQMPLRHQRAITYRQPCINVLLFKGFTDNNM